jgi:hypothetical protein
VYYSQATVDSLIAEHIAVRGQMELVRGLTRDWEELLASKEPVRQSQDWLQTLTNKRSSLRQAMGYLEDGLKNHHAHEDEVMPALVGTLVMKAIRIEHGETVNMMDEINSLVINASLEVFLQKGADIMAMINEICRFASAHSTREDGILLFLKRLPELK